MVLWTFQIALNLLFVTALFHGLRSRRRLQELEMEMEALKRQSPRSEPTTPHLGVAAAPTPQAQAYNFPVLEKPAAVGMTVLLGPEAKAGPGQILEKTAPTPPSPWKIADRYERAEQLLSKGVKIQDVAKDTGLSVSELRLLEKISTKSH